MNMQGLLKQAQKMQKEIAIKEEELKSNKYEATLGGSVLKVVATGDMKIDSVSIDESLLDKSNKEDLEEMIISAVNSALQQAIEDKERVMNAITGGVKVPGGF